MLDWTLLIRERERGNIGSRYSFTAGRGNFVNYFQLKIVGNLYCPDTTPALANNQEVEVFALQCTAGLRRKGLSVTS